MKPSIAEQITISVDTQYIPEHPAASKKKFAFAYEISIKNSGSETVQLINRFWLITNADGEKTEVQGAGVIGEQPVIASGKSYKYTSGAVLETPVGTMEGHYEMKCESGELVRVPIPVFRLAVPNAIN